MDTSVLERIGLTKNEAKVYLTLIRLGQANSAELARESGVHRINVYDVLNSLITKGLASYIVERNVRMFKPENPAQLKEILLDKLNSLESTLPMLLRSFEEKKRDADVSILRGVEGKRTNLEEVMRIAENEINYLFLPHGLRTLSEPPYNTLLPKYYKHLEKNNVRTRLLTPDTPDTRKRAAKLKNLSKNLSIKFSKRMTVQPISWNIVGDLVFLTLLSDPMLIIRIRSKEIAEFFRGNFGMLWNES